MDSLREDDRTTNQQESAVQIGQAVSAVQVLPAHSGMEGEAKERLSSHREKANRNKTKLARCKTLGQVYIPAIALVFAFVYWGYGLSQIG